LLTEGGQVKVTTMPDALSARLDAAVEAIPRAYPGPGGAIAVLKEGELLIRHTWGWANAERRIPFTPRTLFRMCSITKQFTCAAALDAHEDLSVLDDAVRDRLPKLEEPAPRAAHLAHNQSGLRDYWAVAMLLGSPAEAPFGDVETGAIVAATRSLQFAPGSRFSYVNQNFRVLGDIVAERAGVTFADLLRTRVFERAGMETAFLAADTSAMPDGATGYEGTQAGGFRAAENRIQWTGDAGLGASLDDMIAWERHIDTTRDDPHALYSRLSAPVAFSDGRPATYGFGLARGVTFGRALTGHGGGLRGWRSHRSYMPNERISVVVMFNHLSNAGAAATDLVAALLDESSPKPDPGLSQPDWLGAYAEPETGLSVRAETGPAGQVRLRFGHAADTLDLCADGSAGRDGGPRLRPDDGGLWLDRPGDNASTLLAPLAPPTSARDIVGHYRCDELAAELTVTGAGGVLYGGFSGALGQGRMELLDPIAADVWALPCHRALDHTPPGDWTLAFRRDAGAAVAGVTVGCWLARGLKYDRVK
jgi:D-aminopeptidase